LMEINAGRCAPQKGRMILQHMGTPLLETPFEVSGKGVFTPNDQLFGRGHRSVIPISIDLDTFRLSVRGHVWSCEPVLGQLAGFLPAARAGQRMGQVRPARRRARHMASSEIAPI
jgi:hypothetical protein